MNESLLFGQDVLRVSPPSLHSQGSITQRSEPLNIGTHYPKQCAHVCSFYSTLHTAQQMFHSFIQC